MGKDNRSSRIQYEEQLSEPVTCLGMEFENDEARRDYFTKQLKEKLKDPEFHEIEGFPIGTDEAILELSDPPYYTACPNPWLSDFVTKWEAEKPEKSADYYYHREPFAADVSEGKSDPIYKAHSYHTKVPHKAIMRYILHYTEPGDIVYDGFAGSGMTGVAAQLCGNSETVMSMGYQVNEDGTILEEEKDENDNSIWVPFSKLGVRYAVINDLSPVATFIASNYNSPIKEHAFEGKVEKILKEVENEYAWMYETQHTDGSIGKINYTIWSDVFVCPECSNEVIFWDEAVDEEEGKVLDTFHCNQCHAELSKKKIERASIAKLDSANNEVIVQVKQVPIMINYTVYNQRFEKKPDEFDKNIIQKIELVDIPYWFPTDRMIEGRESRRNDNIGLTHVDNYFTKRNLIILAAFWSRAKSNSLRFLLTSLMFKSTKLCAPLMSNYFAAKKGKNRGGWVGKERSGTLYYPSIHSEVSIFPQVKSRSRSTSIDIGLLNNFIISNSSTSNIQLESNTLDYIFLDPPFGANINYSEMSFLWESWLRVKTNNKLEAIENSTQGKGLAEYRELMTASFKEAYRILKPGKWMTVEFSNTKASVWNSIQTALTDVGFIIANVSALDKKQGSINAYTTSTAVKQDLIISAYKPNGGFEERFKEEAQTEAGVWDFIRTHLGYLTPTKGSAGKLEFIPERDPRILFDQVVAYYVRKGYMVPISSQEFQLGLSQYFAERDGMFFLPEQVAEYDKKKMRVKELVQMSLFVFDESSAIAWLRQQLKQKPQTFQDLNPQFMQETGGWSKNEKMLELSTLLEENFLLYDGQGKVPEQIHAYLSSNWKDMRKLNKEDSILIEKGKNRWYVPDPNKAGDLEKVREKSLLKEFEIYRQRTKKFTNRDKFRIEAVRAGFKKAWQKRDYDTIIAIAKKMPKNVLEEDQTLLMFLDNSVTRVGG